MYKPTISIVLDTRRSTKKNLFPVKLRATFQVGELGKKKWVQKYYSLKSYATEEDFAAAESGKTRTDKQKKIRGVIKDAENRATKILEDHTVVTQELFSHKFSMQSLYSVGDVFNLVMGELLAAGRIGNYHLYKTTRNSIARFVDPALKKMKTRKKADDIKVNMSFLEINKDWLRRYREWANKEVSKTTIAIYLRHLRAVFNRAIDLMIVKADIYPFGKHGVKIKKTAARKHRLIESDIKKLLAVNHWAVDFWAMSYFCYGINMMDVASLRIKDLKDDVIIIQRTKTQETDGRLLVIPLRQEAKDIITRRGNKTLNPDDYVFPILSPGLTPIQIKNRVNDFTGKINEGLKKVQEELKLDESPKAGNARHSFASLALEKGASKEFIQEALGHASMQTTEEYLSGFGVKIKRAIGAKIYDS